MDEEFSSLILSDSELRAGFVSWVAGECRVVNRKRNRLALSQTLLAKAGGSSKSSMELASQQTRSIVPISTFYRRFINYSTNALQLVEAELLDDARPRLHWVDNFAKYYASSSMFTNRDLLKECQWTAHGFKRLPTKCDMAWRRQRSGDTIPALPHLDELFAQEHFESLVTELNHLAQPFFNTSVVFLRDVRRIPLKMVESDDDLEQVHLDESSDGLRYFFPVDIYSHNITAIDGLVSVLEILQQQEGFGSLGHRRAGRYSLLHVDVKIFWQLLRMLYSYPGLVGMRHDLFLLFGFWHAYHYAHVALWNEFRHTFLGPAFFSLFPDHKLMQRPKLTQSSTFFMWLRLAYPMLKEKLVASLATLKQRVITNE